MLNALPLKLPAAPTMPDPSVQPQQPLAPTANFEAIFELSIQQAEVVPALPEPTVIEAEYQAATAPIIAPLPPQLMPALGETEAAIAESTAKTAEAKIDIAPPSVADAPIPLLVPQPPAQAAPTLQLTPQPSAGPTIDAEPAPTETAAPQPIDFPIAVSVKAKPIAPEAKPKETFTSLSLTAPVSVKPTPNAGKAVPAELAIVEVKPTVTQPIAPTQIALYPTPLSPDIAAPSPTPIAAEPLDMLHSDRWLNDLSAELAALPADTNRILFRLSPDNLGQLDIMLNRCDDSFALELRANSEEAQSMIANWLPRLEQELRAKVRMPVEAQLSSNHQTADQGQRQQHRPDRGAYRSPETTTLQPKAADHPSADRLA